MIWFRMFGLVVFVTLSFAGRFALAVGDAVNGEKVFNQCKVCHSIVEGKNGVGPSLFRVVGRKSGSVAGYKYSDAIAKANISWDEKNLDAYIKDPKAVVPGGKMPFAGLKKDQDREDVIAFLKAKAQ
ncbi:MAG TPA: cytochrome c family protein [Alphaproteobacteria bacterium]|nr:cytochrome c family protein [Alphaproteobacteria bacterium]